MPVWEVVLGRCEDVPPARGDGEIYRLKAGDFGLDSAPVFGDF